MRLIYDREKRLLAIEILPVTESLLTSTFCYAKMTLSKHRGGEAPVRRTIPRSLSSRFYFWVCSPAEWTRLGS